MNKIFDVITFLFTGKGSLANEMIAAGVISYAGQGRDEYGR